MMAAITHISGLEILDSRGRPTIKATVILEDGSTGSASVPSGASTGRAEVCELRDGDPGRFMGLGCQSAVSCLEGEIREMLSGRSFHEHFALEKYLIDLDGTPDKSRLGGNTILSVSLAFARAAATSQHIPLYRYFADLRGNKDLHLPRLTINLFSGGLHAGGQVEIQDCLIVPLTPGQILDRLSVAYAVYQAAKSIIHSRYGMRPLTADEGGLSPGFATAEDMIATTVDAIRLAGFVPGEEVAIAIDVAATHFYRDAAYQIGKLTVSAEAMIEQLAKWVATYPILSVEDGLAEEDWAHWPLLVKRCSGQALILGDDLLCTTPGRVAKAIELRAANALLLKVNQIGSLMEASEALNLARNAGWHVTFSARSGETEDNWLADLAVGWGADDIKIGSITQSERLSKYNRLLEIEKDLPGHNP